MVVRHGIDVWLKRKRIHPSIEGAKEVESLLSMLRKRLVKYQADSIDDLDPIEIMLIDDTIEAYGVRMLVAQECRKRGVFNPVNERRGQVELQPALKQSYIAYSNLIRLNMLALRDMRKDRAKGSPMTPEKIIQLVKMEKAERRRKK